MFNRKNSIENRDAYVEERLSEYLDGTLSAKEREIVDAYLATSPTARASLESLRYTVRLLKQTPAPSLPRQFTLPVTSRAPAQGAPAWMAWALRGVAVAATAAFVILLTATLLRPTPAQDAAIVPMMASQPAAPTVVALAPTATADTLQMQALPSNAESNSVVSTMTPFMITEESPTDQPGVLPITETSDAANKAYPTNAPVLTQDATSPAPTLPTLPPPPSQAPQPTQAPPTAAAADSSASGSTAPAATERQPGTPTDQVLTQRSMIFRAVEGVVLVEQLRVRRGPGTQFRSMGGLKLGDVVMILGRNQNGVWLAIDYPDNQPTGLGWVVAMYVDVTEPLENIPILDASGFPLPSLTPPPTKATPVPEEATPTPEVEVTLEPAETPHAEQTPEP